jgi:RNA polymerase sigma-70 factor (ECF subfamily)
MPGPPSETPRGTSLTLLERLRENQADAWNRLVRLYGPLLRYWCGRWGVHGGDAEDITQEVFRAVVSGIERFRRDEPGASFRGWLHGVTRHRLLMHFRGHNRQPHGQGGTDAFVRLQELADGTAHVPDDDDPPGELAGLYHRGLELVRGEFEERTWQMFWRTVVDGESPDRIADELGVSAAAVRKAKSRVLRRLKEELGELME